MKHVNIPVFVPHMGCPNKCVFCDQNAISGVNCFSEEKAKLTVEAHLATTCPGDECEIAFFGGSFTGIDRSLMIRLLDMAESYVKKGKVVGIRMSTRPDYVNGEIVSILRRYTVSAVELGVQSMSDRVLVASARGHSAADSERAFDMLSEAGFPTVGQMMIGLPGSTPDDEIDCARRICLLGAVSSRLYPTVVFERTELHEMMKRGEYAPLTVQEAVGRSADALEVFASYGVRCLRVGLYGSDRLAGEGKAVAGPCHAAFGELVASECYRREIRRQIDSSARSVRGATLLLEVPKGDLSCAIGHRGANREYFFAEYAPKKMEFIENERLLRYNIKVNVF